MPTVLMGDPAHFHIQGGANPFTRDRWGRRKAVDRERAIDQWRQLKHLLETLGVTVWAIPPQLACPGLVYPANWGVRIGSHFILANLLPSRAAEQPVYRDFLRAHGIEPETIGARFEGEADLIATARGWLFTHGRLRRQRFVPRLGWPPWRRVYGFRSERRAVDEFTPFGLTAVLPLELRLETHYHGDTVLCPFGPRREFLLAWLSGLQPSSRRALQERFGDRLLPLPDADAFRYAANSWSLASGGRQVLLMPAGVSETLQAAIRARGVEPLCVDVSEFLKKGGGAVKCLLGDLGAGPLENGS